MLNVRKEDLNAGARRYCRRCKRPTISTLSDPDWLAVNTRDRGTYRLGSDSASEGSQSAGDREYPLNKVVM